VAEEERIGYNALVQVILTGNCVVKLCYFSFIQNTVVGLTHLECMSSAH